MVLGAPLTVVDVTSNAVITNSTRTEVAQNSTNTGKFSWMMWIGKGDIVPLVQGHSDTEKRNLETQEDEKPKKYGKPHYWRYGVKNNDWNETKFQEDVKSGEIQDCYDYPCSQVR